MKNADCVGFAHHLECRRVILGNVREIERTPAITAKLQRILHDRHHPESEQVDLNNAKIFTIILVPLRNDAAGHRRIFQRHEGAELVLADDHATGVLTEVPRQSIHRAVKPQERRHAWMVSR